MALTIEKERMAYMRVLRKVNFAFIFYCPIMEKAYPNTVR